MLKLKYLFLEAFELWAIMWFSNVWKVKEMMRSNQLVVEW